MVAEVGGCATVSCQAAELSHELMRTHGECAVEDMPLLIIARLSDYVRAAENARLERLERQQLLNFARISKAREVLESIGEALLELEDSVIAVTTGSSASCSEPVPCTCASTMIWCFRSTTE